jgi:hypothetical protein
MLSQCRKDLAFGFNQAAESLLEGLADCPPGERRSILAAVEWFEAQRDRLENEDAVEV